jgi:uncharacterized protein (DUF4415 family)
VGPEGHQVRRKRTLGGANMKKEYDFSKMNGQKNPYVKDLKTQITIRLDKETIDYFKELSTKTGMTYQNLINLYLRECADMKKVPIVHWTQPA